MNAWKKLLCLLLTLLLGIPAASARADSLDEWNRSCRRKTICETEIYVGDPLRYKTTIPANTYVKVHSATDVWASISYRTASGQSGMGLAKPECIGFATIVFTDADGDRRGMQELEYYDLYGNGTPPGAIMDQVWPGHTDYQTFDPYNQGVTGGGSASNPPADGNGGGTSDPPAGNTGNTGSKPGANTGANTGSAANSSAAASKAPVQEAKVFWQGEQVSIVRLGTQTAVIRHAGEEREVPTGELEFPGEVPGEKRIASIYAPRTGKASLRARASDSGKVLQKCEAGNIVFVLETGSQWTQISYRGQVGYVLTACLDFHPAGEEPIGTGVLHYEGKTTGSRVFAIRNAADGESAIVGDWRIGSQVLVFAEKDVWVEIEMNGQRGWVRDKYLQMDGE